MDPVLPGWLSDTDKNITKNSGPAHLQLSLQLLDLLEGLLSGALHVLRLQSGKFARLPDVPLGIPVPHDLPDLLQVVNVLQAAERSPPVRSEDHDTDMIP